MHNRQDWRAWRVELEPYMHNHQDRRAWCVELESFIHNFRTGAPGVLS